MNKQLAAIIIWEIAAILVLVYLALITGYLDVGLHDQVSEETLLIAGLAIAPIGLWAVRVLTRGDHD